MSKYHFEMETLAKVEDYKVIYSPATLKARGITVACCAEWVVPVFGAVGHVIVVDDVFMKYPDPVRKFFVLHEVGHLEHGDLDTAKEGSMATDASGTIATHERHGLHPMEEAADRYAIDRCTTSELKLVYKALKWISWFRFIVPGFSDTRIRAGIVKKEIRKREKAEKSVA